MSRRILALTLLLLGSAPLHAHDYWLSLGGAGDPPAIGIRLCRGDQFAEENERPYQKAMTVRFFIRITGANNVLTSKEDSKPYGTIKTRSVGTHLVVLDRAPSLLKLEAEKFNKYLKDEGLEGILEERRKAGEDKAPGRERYSRYLKTLIQLGKDLDNATATYVAGQKLEIVPQVNPYSLGKGDDFSVVILFEGKPLAGAKVFAHRHEKGQTKTQTAITSKDGLVTFKLDETGFWLIRLVHMRRAVKDADADWESFWGSLTFSVR